MVALYIGSVKYTGSVVLLLIFLKKDIWFEIVVVGYNTITYISATVSPFNQKKKTEQSFFIFFYNHTGEKKVSQALSPLHAQFLQPYYKIIIKYTFISFDIPHCY